MTPTEELRTKLDELGVEWWPSDDPCCEDVITHWCVGPFQWTAIEGEKDLWLNAGIAGHEPLTPEQAVAATIGRSYASCTEMDNPESSADAMREALEWHFEHVPRSTNPHNTCVVLQGEKPPEEVLFVRYEGGVTHYLPEDVGTCKRIYHPNRITKTCTCSNCGYGASDERWAYCPKCGHKYVHGEVEEQWKRAGRKVAE